VKVIKPSIQILDDLDGMTILKHIERAGRTCYKSEDKITDDSCLKFVKNVVARGHESVIEHEKVSVLIVCDRGVTHEIVRHRIASYSQESTRYCNYGDDKFGNELTFIQPCFWEENSEVYVMWWRMMQQIEQIYLNMMQRGVPPQEARAILPNSLKTEIVVTMNMREWRHFLKLRTSPASHPQIREVAYMILKEFKEKIPVLFDDIESEEKQ